MTPAVLEQRVLAVDEIDVAGDDGHKTVGGGFLWVNEGVRKVSGRCQEGDVAGDDGHETIGGGFLYISREGEGEI